jgi:hypothetical protein
VQCDASGLFGEGASTITPTYQPPAIPAAPERAENKRPWAGITEAEAKRVAAHAVQMLADSEPDSDMIAAQDRLEGTPQAHMYCVDGAMLEELIAAAISNAAHDATVPERAETPMGYRRPRMVRA